MLLTLTHAHPRLAWLWPVQHSKATLILRISRFDGIFGRVVLARGSVASALVPKLLCSHAHRPLAIWLCARAAAQASVTAQLHSCIFSLSLFSAVTLPRSSLFSRLTVIQWDPHHAAPVVLCCLAVIVHVCPATLSRHCSRSLRFCPSPAPTFPFLSCAALPLLQGLSQASQPASPSQPRCLPLPLFGLALSAVSRRPRYSTQEPLPFVSHRPPPPKPSFPFPILLTIPCEPYRSLFIFSLLLIARDLVSAAIHPQCILISVPSATFRPRHFDFWNAPSPTSSIDHHLVDAH